MEGTVALRCCRLPSLSGGAAKVRVGRHALKRLAAAEPPRSSDTAHLLGLMGLADAVKAGGEHDAIGITPFSARPAKQGAGSAAGISQAGDFFCNLKHIINNYQTRYVAQFG